MFLSSNHSRRTSLVGVMFLVLSFIAVVPAQTSDSIEIVVKDSNGSPIAGAAVDATLGGLTVRSLFTDSAGTAKFLGLRSGNYRFSAAASGFSNLTREVAFPAKTPTPIEIILDVSGVSAAVTVTATRTQVTADETAVPVSVVGRELIEEKNINSVGDIFRTLPGTSTVNEGAFQVRPRIRGLDSNRVLILVDGERLNNSRTSTGQSGIEGGLVDIGQIESVEVVRGSGSVLYGTDALGGTINILTRDTPARRTDGFRFGARLNTLFSSNESARRGTLSVNGSGKYFAFDVSQSMERSGNYFTGDPSPDFVRNLRDASFEGITDEGEALNSQSHGSNSTATVRFFLNDSNTLRANYDRRRAGNVGSAGLVGTFNGFFPFSNRDKVSVRYDSVAVADFLPRVSINAFYQTQYRNFTNILTVPPVLPFFPGLYQFSETVTDTKTTGFDLQTDWKLGSRNYLTAGASFFRDENTDHRLAISATTPSSPNRTFNNTRSVPDASLSNFAAFAQDEFRLTRRFKIVGGIRVDNFKTNAEPTTGFALRPMRPQDIEDLGIGELASGLDVSSTAVTGDIGAVFNLTDEITLSSRVGRSFRTPNIFELFFTDSGSVGGYVVGNPALKPESGINFDSTVKYRTKRLSASATYFNNSYKNFLATVEARDRGRDFVFTVDPLPVQVYQTQNVDRARIQGFETEFDAPFRISMGYLTPYGNFSWLRGDDTETDQPLNFISPIRAIAGVRWQNVGKNYFFDYNSRMVTKQERLSDSFFSTPVNQGGNGGAEPGFVTHNVSGGYYFRRERFNLSVNLGVSNIFDRAYSEQFTFAPARGRSFTIGTTWEIR
ncbi:MAG TPA: TonB-dependent receptor [Pyrinomonadaceae bacterium]|nr:TonB-dependent receptor [Pyrinomonadaceae bacterium]